MEMGRRVLIPERKHLFSQHWGDLWNLPVKDNKLWLREVTEARKYRKRSRDIEISGGEIFRKLQRVHGSPKTEEHQVVIFRTPLSIS